MRVVLAGAQSKKPLEMLIGVNAPNILVSYYYMRKQGDKGLSILKKAKEAGMWLMCDSGAYSYKIKYPWLRLDQCDRDGNSLVDWLKQEDLDLAREEAGNPSRAEVISELVEYFEGYMTWLKDHAQYLDAYAELDLDMFIEEMMWEWRQRCLNEIDNSKTELIITPHLYDSQDDYNRIFDMTSFIGMEAGANDQYYTDFFTRNMDTLTERKIKCHGWAMTNYKAIIKWPFYSCDSTTWTMGSRFGYTYKVDSAHKINTFGPDQKKKRSQWKRECDEAGVDYKLFVADKTAEVDKFNAFQWAKFSRDMMSYNINSYWLSADERADEIEQAQSEWRTALSVKRHDYSVQTDARDLATLEYGRYCNTCFLNQKCPAYQRDATCSIADRPSITDGHSLKDTLFTLLELQTERVAFGAFAEKISGTPLDVNVSKEMLTTFNLVKATKEIFDTRDEIVIKAKTQQGSGLIAQLFGGYGKAGQANPAQVRDDPEGNVIDAEVEKTTDPGDENISGPISEEVEHG